MKKRQALLYVSIIAFLLFACQDSPKKSVVTSRNDGSFDTNVVQSAEESHAPDATESLTVFDTFVSTDALLHSKSKCRIQLTPLICQ